jgi:hypothetical protein
VEIDPHRRSRRPRELHGIAGALWTLAFCGRAHKDEISKLIGIDPNCAKNHHLPHDIAAANIAWNAATNCWAWSPMTWRHVFNDLQLTPRGMKPRRRRRAI